MNDKPHISVRDLAEIVTTFMQKMDDGLLRVLPPDILEKIRTDPESVRVWAEEHQIKFEQWTSYIPEHHIFTLHGRATFPEYLNIEPVYCEVKVYVMPIEFSQNDCN